MVLTGRRDDGDDLSRTGAGRELEATATAASVGGDREGVSRRAAGRDGHRGLHAGRRAVSGLAPSGRRRRLVASCWGD